MRKILIPALLGLALFVPTTPAHAVSKEIVQLQTQVQALQDALNQMQRSNAEQLGVLQHLVEQSNDNINRITQQMTSLSAKVDAEGQNNPLSGQIQSLNDSVDELKTRLGKIDASLTTIQNQMQNVNAPPAGAATAAAGQQQPAPAALSQQVPQQGAGSDGTNVPLSGGAQAPNAGNVGGTGTGVAPEGQLYQSALRDYNGAKYDLATSEFADIVKNYPGSDLAGNASFYLGEVAYRQGLYPAAIRNYDVVLEQFPGNSKAPAAELRKGEAELASSQREAGIADLRALIQRYPTSPEGAQARSLLNGMGVRISAKPSPGRAQ